MQHIARPSLPAPAPDERREMMQAAERIIAATRAAYAERERKERPGAACRERPIHAGATVRPWMS